MYRRILIVSGIILLLLLVSRSIYLNQIFQNPGLYKAHVPGGIESLQWKQFGNLRLKLLPADNFELTTSIHKDSISDQEVWLLLNKRIPLYAQFSEYTIVKNQMNWSARSAIKNAISIWEESFQLKKVNERFYNDRNGLNYEGLYQDQMGEVQLKCVLEIRGNNAKLFIIRGPGFQKVLLDSIVRSMTFSWSEEI